MRNLVWLTGAAVMASLSGTAVGQMAILSQVRTLSTQAQCFGGFEDTENASATNFGPFIESVTSTSECGSLSFASATASQNSQMGPSQLSGSLSAGSQSRQGGTSANSTYSVTFDVAGPASYSMTLTPTGPLAPRVTMTGPYGTVFDLTVLGSTMQSGILYAGRYTFTASASSGTLGGSSMAASANLNFTFNAASRPLPGILAGPIIRGQGTCTEASYYVLTPSDWDQADAKARMLGGTLVAINDVAEQDFVFNTLGMIAGVDYMWLGITDLGQPGNYRWVTGQPVTYSNWLGGFPSATDDFGLMLSRFTGSPASRWISSPNTEASPASVFGVVEVHQCRCRIIFGGMAPTSTNFFEFLDDFFAAAPAADVNCDETVNSEDFFAFLECFFDYPGGLDCP